MKVVSTRNLENQVTFRDALFQGLAPDGGLYIPEEFNDLRDFFLTLKKDEPFSVLAQKVLMHLLGDEATTSQIQQIAKDAFPFEPRLVDLEKGIKILELFHGPSSAFKDFGASFLASAMSIFLKEDNKRSIILTATSGDTGSAVAQAFFGKPNVDVVVLYPSGRVSPLQEKQLTTLGGNVYAAEVIGSFDDCQKMVKEAFLSPDLRNLPLTSANSINLGRLLPQSLYYIWAFTQLRDELEDELIFTVPSGNFGNLTAGVYAWKWGLPVSHFLAVTNSNKVVPDYLSSGYFQPRPSVTTYSNAMDVGNPSNFERLENLFQKNHQLMGALISGDSVTDLETLETMREVYHSRKMDICPHTAVGITAARKLKLKHSGDPGTQVVLATAHPAKFLEVVQKATGSEPELPANLKALQNKNKLSVVIGPTLEELKPLLLPLGK